MLKSWKCSYFFPHMGIDEGHCVSFQFAFEKKKNALQIALSGKRKRGSITIIYLTA